MEDQQSPKPRTFSEQEVEELVEKAVSKAVSKTKETAPEKHSRLRDPIWDFVNIPTTVLLALLGIGAAFLIFYLGRDIKSVRITVLATTSLAQVADAVSDDIQLLYKGDPIPGLSLVQIKLENDGNVEIRSTDYESPITLIFPSEATVVNASIVESEPNGLGLSMDSQGNQVTLSKILLNPKDRVVLRILVVEPSEKPLTLLANARIAGLSNIPVESALQESKDPTVKVTPIELSIVVGTITLFAVTIQLVIARLAARFRKRVTLVD